MRESEVESLSKYIWRLTAEIVGGSSLYPHLKNDSYYASLLNILQYLCDHQKECSVEQTKQLVFEGIHICEKLAARYEEEENAHAIGTEEVTPK